ncbi:MAG: transferase, partial [Candidatus Eremiobacterota bacterium]
MGRPLILFGAGDFAEIAHYYFQRDSDYEVLAFTVDGAHLGATAFCGLPCLAFEELTRDFPP